MGQAAEELEQGYQPFISDVSEYRYLTVMVFFFGGGGIHHINPFGHKLSAYFQKISPLT